MKVYKNYKIVSYLKLCLLLIGILIGVYLIQRGISFLSDAMGQRASLVVDAGVSYDTRGGVWRNFAQGGEERVNMLFSVRDKTKLLKPEYIRIDHMYDFYDVIKKDTLGNLVFDWTKLDQVVGDILIIGAKPFFSLSYSPDFLSNGSVSDFPINLLEWEGLVQKTIEHYSGKSNLAISNVYYEVWNEPDLFGEFKTRGEKNYLDLYFHSVKAGNNAINTLPFKMGGPATSHLYKQWFFDLLNFAERNSLRMDFYSWHRYSKKLGDFEKDVKDVKSWLVNFDKFKDIELIISEQGFTPENDSGYDESYGAIHTLAVSSILENTVDRSFLFEIKDGPGDQKFWGRWGIFTHEKFGVPEPKPRYLAIEFLNQMQGKRVNIAGQGSWVKAFAKKDGLVVRLLVVNYDPNGKHTEAVPVSFVNLPFNYFSLKRIDFLGGTRKSEIQTDSEDFSITELFAPNSAAIFELSPL